MTPHNIMLIHVENTTTTTTKKKYITIIKKRVELPRMEANLILHGNMYVLGGLKIENSTTTTTENKEENKENNRKIEHEK